MLANFIDLFVSKAGPGALAFLADKMPRYVLEWNAEDAFRQTVRYAYKYSKFYKRRFDELNIDVRKIRRPSDLKDFYTMPLDIIEHAEDFICSAPNMVFESSGTTGRNKRVYASMEELDRIGKFNAASMLYGGIAKTDRLVNAFDFNIWIPGMITQKTLEQSGMFGMAAGKVDPMEVYSRIPIYKFNIVMGEPTWLIKLTELAEKHGSYPLKFIIGGAERMPDAARSWMSKVWQGAQIRMVYASVESTGTIAYEAFNECEGYHIDETNFIVEIVDAGEDGYGEVVFTTLSRRTMPLIRYKNRDISKITDVKCNCGLPYKRLAKIRGRADELVVASGGNLYPLMFENIFKDIDGIASDWQIIFRLRGIREVMEINLEVREGVLGDVIKKKVFANIKSRYPDLWKNMEIAIFETDFVFHVPGTLRSDRKLLRLIDKRS